MKMMELLVKIIDLVDRRCTFTSYLVIAMTTGAFTLTGIIMFHEVPKDAQSMVYALVGGVWGSVATIVTFRFGSSSNGQKKTDAIIAKMSE